MKDSHSSFVKKGIYDYCIIGGGISGLYLAYRILQKDPLCKLIILEKESQFGGRIMTGSIKGNQGSLIPIPAGAGRFSKEHLRFMALLREFRLIGKIVELSKVVHYHHIRKVEGGKSQVVIFSEEHMKKLIEKVVRGSHKLSKRVLIDMSFVELAERFLSKEEVQYIKDSFGYYAELVVMNAFSCLKLMKELSSKFYALRGGYMPIIDELVVRIRKLGGIALNRCFVYSVISNNDGFMIEYGNKTIYSRKCIFAIPMNAVMKFPIFNPICPLINICNTNSNPVICVPLCRIYATYPVGIGGSVWFKGMGRITTNNNIRMIIPISEEDGVIMISYSDHLFAGWWKSIYDREGKRGLKREIRSSVSDVVGFQIPDCLAIEIYYWNCGVGYWAVGSDGNRISQALVHPIANLGLYICNENIAVDGQQWMEGSLEMADKVMGKLFST